MRLDHLLSKKKGKAAGLTAGGKENTQSAGEGKCLTESIAYRLLISLLFSDIPVLNIIGTVAQVVRARA